jgi:hypothetical protein
MGLVRFSVFGLNQLLIAQGVLMSVPRAYNAGAERREKAGEASF